jgi:hypothetical protein
MVELDYGADLGILTDSEIDTLIEIEEALGEAAVGQNRVHGLSISLEVDAPSVAAALNDAEARVRSLLYPYTVSPGELAGSQVKTLAAFQAEVEQPNYPDLVSSAEAAKILGVTRQRVHQLHRDHPEFPTPLYELRTGPLWVRAGIEGFGRRWTRKPGRPSKMSA